MRKYLVVLLIVLMSSVMLWGQYSGTGTFEKVEDLTGLESGAYYVFYGIDGGYTGATGATGAMTNTVSSNTLANTAVTVSDNSIVDPDESIVWRVDGNATDGYTVFNEAVNKYAEIAENNTSGFSLNNPSTHEYVVSYNPEKGFVFKSNHSSGNSRCISIFNANEWRCYSVGQHLRPLDLYKLSGSSDPTTVATPVFTPGAGVYYEAQEVSISCTTEGATIYYTLDGSVPTTSSTEYTAPFNLTASTTVKAYAVKADWTDSEVAESIITIEILVVPTGMFISEYIEGSSYNKAIEIYNGTGSTVDLTPYIVKLGINGSSWSTTCNLEGTLAAGEVFVIVHTQAGSPIHAVKDTINAVVNFNGDDAVGLFYNDVLIDQIGVYQERPNTGWDVAGISKATADHTLVRKNSVTQGTTDWALSAGTNAEDSQWIVYPKDTFNYLGSHGEVVLPLVATPAITPVAGQYELQVEVTMTCETDGATIYYTEDGSDPTTASTEYTVPFLVTESSTVKAFAVKAEHDDSAIAEVAYVITEELPEGVDPAVGTLYMSKISAAPSFNNSYIEFYNNSADVLSLENVKLKMIKADGTTESTFNLNDSNYIGDTFILPYSYIIITRNGTKADFETDFGPLPEGVTFLQGSGGMYFATGTMRRWQLVLDTGAKAEIIIDDTLEPAGGTGHASYQASPGNWIHGVDYTLVTPGVPYMDQTLPVTLSSFMAVQTSENFAQISWTAESETSLLGYNLFRNEMDDVDRAIRINNTLIESQNISTSHSYSYIDNEVDMNTTYYYWLQINETDATFSFYGPAQIRIDENNDTPEIVIPTKTTLNNVYPNPFNPTTAVSFYMGEEESVTLNVYNMKGQLIANLATEKFAEGFHNVVWNGKDANGRDCASGIYFFRMETKSDVQTIKGILMK